MLQKDIIERANHAMLIAQANGFERTADAIRVILDEIKTEPVLETQTAARFAGKPDSWAQ